MHLFQTCWLQSVRIHTRDRPGQSRFSCRNAAIPAVSLRSTARSRHPTSIAPSLEGKGNSGWSAKVKPRLGNMSSRVLCTSCLQIQHAPLFNSQFTARVSRASRPHSSIRSFHLVFVELRRPTFQFAVCRLCQAFRRGPSDRPPSEARILDKISAADDAMLSISLNSVEEVEFVPCKALSFK